MLFENDWVARQMLILNSPEPDILSATRNKPVAVARCKFDALDMKIADLFGQYLRFLFSFDILYRKYNDRLPIITVCSNDRKQAIV